MSMYNGMQLYRGVISYVDETTTYALIPAFTGSELPMKLSNVLGTPTVSVGDQVVLAVEDSKAYNIHIVYKEFTGVDGGGA